MPGVFPPSFVSPTGGSVPSSGKNLSNLHEFMSSISSFQSQYTYGENIYEGTNAFPAIVMSEPIILETGSPTDDPFAEMNFMLSSEAALGDNEGLSYKNLTKRGITQTLLFKCRVIGHPDRPGPDYVVPLPDNMDLEDPVTRTRIRMHKNFYWYKRPEDELPVLAIGDVVMIQFEDMRTFDNGYATHVIEKTENPGTVVGPGGISQPGSGGYNMNSLFEDSSARDIAAAGGSGPAAQEPTEEQVTEVQPVVDELCEWTGPYPLKDGNLETISGVFVNGVIIKKAAAPYFVILLNAMKAAAIKTDRLWNSGFRAAFVATVGDSRSPKGVITVADQETNVVGETTPVNCKDWDGKTPSRAIKNQTSQQTLAWKNCNPTKGKRGMEGYSTTLAKEGEAKQCEPGTSTPGPKSPHPKGVAIDMNTGSKEGTLASISTVYKWMMDNAYRYGFVRTVKTERWHWEYRPGKHMFNYVAMDHATWNTYFTTARYAPSVPTTVPATSPVLTEEDAIAATGDL